MKITKRLKEMQRENLNQSWMVAFATTGLFAFITKLVPVAEGLSNAIIKSDIFVFPWDDFVHFGMGIIFLWLASQIESKKI